MRMREMVTWHGFFVLRCQPLKSILSCAAASLRCVVYRQVWMGQGRIRNPWRATVVASIERRVTSSAISSLDRLRAGVVFSRILRPHTGIAISCDTRQAGYSIIPPTGSRSLSASGANRALCRRALFFCPKQVMVESLHQEHSYEQQKRAELPYKVDSAAAADRTATTMMLLVTLRATLMSMMMSIATTIMATLKC